MFTMINAYQPYLTVVLTAAVLTRHPVRLHPPVQTRLTPRRNQIKIKETCICSTIRYDCMDCNMAVWKIKLDTSNPYYLIL